MSTELATPPMPTSGIAMSVQYSEGLEDEEEEDGGGDGDGHGITGCACVGRWVGGMLEDYLNDEDQGGDRQYEHKNDEQSGDDENDEDQRDRDVAVGSLFAIAISVQHPASAPAFAQVSTPVPVPVAPLIELASSPFIVPSSPPYPYQHRLSLIHTSTNTPSRKSTNAITFNVNITSVITITGIRTRYGGAVQQRSACA
ncbi:hypothetical protein CVT25_010280 [Psilocybe cyanescens]|uniref:Uncharacterized protein n=1 Tax=Psilocybe cyanescens TaxID=93625 RepID=A0A409X2R6_PSICY|nr:hypothetical protein CVT25_010280 [Psilocybe cyanescens]